MAKGKFQQWMEPARLEQITNWVANGATDEQVARQIGIHPSTFYEWMLKHAEISEAVKKGRELQLPSMENVFFSRARGGYTVTETIEEFRGEVVDGKPYNGTIVKRTVKKQLPPDTTALIFYLKNKGGYRSETAPDESEPAALERAREILAEVPSVIDGQAG